MRLIGLCGLVSLLIASAQPAHATEPPGLVLARAGNLPILITAPHGGQAAVLGVASRDVSDKPRGGRQYEVTRDVNTDVIAEGLARYLETATGSRPYLVAAAFHRKYIDANRPPQIAYDSPAAEPYYRSYHDSIRRFVQDILRAYPAGLLIDVHGQTLMPSTVIRGTLNGQSVARLLQRVGSASVTGTKGLFGLIEAQGMKVFPPNAALLVGTAENAGFSGGYTVATYGSHQSGGIDAIQIEIGAVYRKESELQITIDRIGKAIVIFYEAHMKQAQR